MSRRGLTHEQFMERFMKKNFNAGDIEILEKYKGSHIKIKCRCKKDGYEWEIKPNDLLNNHGCPKCGGKIKKTHEQFIKELKEINSDIEILGKYKTNKTKIKVKCKIDGHIWTPTPDNLLRGSGCPKCYGNVKKTHEQFIKELKEVNSDIEVLDTYISAMTKIKVKCKIDGHIWETKPNGLISNNNGCPICGEKNRIEKQTKTHEQFIKELKEVNSDIEVLGQYIKSDTKIKVKCKIDGHIWEVSPNSLLNNKNGCPKCNSSKGEKKISKYLDSINLKYIPQYTFKDCKCKNVLPFDFYIPSLNIIIEYDGRQHFEIIEYFGGIDVFIDTKIRDTIKTKYCKKNNIKLIRIPFWDFDNIEGILKNSLI